MDWLNYHHLLYFWTVVREGGVAQAAQKLKLSHPTVSTQVKQLERALGEKLLALTTHTAIDPAVDTYYHRALGGSRTPGALIDNFAFTL